VNSRLLQIIGVLLAMLAARVAGTEPADSNQELRTASGSAVQYYLSLPVGWDTKTTWPVVVTIDGSGHNFAGNFHDFVRVRRDRPFIIVTPCVSSNGNDPADLPAVLGIVKEVQDQFRGQRADGWTVANALRCFSFSSPGILVLAISDRSATAQTCL
jgi:hypothetical protein